MASKFSKEKLIRLMAGQMIARALERAANRRNLELMNELQKAHTEHTLAAVRQEAREDLERARQTDQESLVSMTQLLKSSRLQRMCTLLTKCSKAKKQKAFNQLKQLSLQAKALNTFDICFKNCLNRLQIQTKFKRWQMKI